MQRGKFCKHWITFLDYSWNFLSPSRSCSFSVSFAPVWKNGSMRVENQWNFFRWLCYIRKNSLPKEKLVLAKMFLIRTSFALFSSPHTPLFTPMVFYFFFHSEKKKSLNREEKKKKNSWKENKRIFSVAHRHLRRKKICAEKMDTAQFKKRFPCFNMKLTNYRNVLALTTFHRVISAIYKRDSLTRTINLPVANFSISIFSSPPTILWRWRLEKPPLVRAWEIFLGLKINTLAR